ncbi:hypothetical protein HPB52_017080 [Rhipicephalus sanguineus]|uniref:Hexosyltransferase n=1 Tax=Rhipicephalus sanguineus TaxID=34632 RepID=A0A9D4SUM5_RHISA|nr:hypothetical protein HPB52_017080 [Rhipicephalus sanguineus]
MKFSQTNLKSAFLFITAMTVGSIVFAIWMMEVRVVPPSFLQSVEQAEQPQAMPARIDQRASPPPLPSSAGPNGGNLTTGASEELRNATNERCPYRVETLHEPAGNASWHSGGWAVRRRCSQPLDTLFFVHTAPRNWQYRAHLRATLFEEAAMTYFNWTVVFFIGEQDDLTVSLWTKLEEEVMGDMVALRYNDTLLSVLHKFVGGMRWVLEYCPNVSNIVKMDDDVGVHPFELRRYLHEELPLKSSHMHCFVWLRNQVYRESSHRFCVHADDLPQDEYPLFCSGRSVILTTDTMRKLYKASMIVRAFATDDAYVTGQLALFANVGHVFINARMDWSDLDKTELMLDGKLLFTHEYFLYGNSIERRAQWGLVLWRHRMEHTTDTDHLDLSYRFDNKLYRRDFENMRRYLQDASLYL